MSTYDRYADPGIEVDELNHIDEHPEIVSVSDMLNSSPSVHLEFYNDFGDLCDLENLPSVPNNFADQGSWQKHYLSVKIVCIVLSDIILVF